MKSCLRLGRLRFRLRLRVSPENSVFFCTLLSLARARSLSLSPSLSLLTVALCARAHCERVDVGKGSKLSRDIKSWLAIWPGRIFISTLCATSCLSLSASVECSQSRVDQAAAVHPITDPIRSDPSATRPRRAPFKLIVCNRPCYRLIVREQTSSTTRSAPGFT